jgi:glucose/arabinose dehydrogenase
VSLSSERGFLGLAFSPGYRQDGFFYVMYTALPDDTTGGALRVSRFHVSATNPDLADPASERVLYDIPHPAGNHNGGKIAFAEGLCTSRRATGAAQAMRPTTRNRS